MDEIAPGIWHWTETHPRIKIDVSSYFLAGPNVLLDPLHPSSDDRLDELGPPTEILLTNRHHLRESLKLRERFGCAIRAPEVGMHEFDEGEPVDPYAYGDKLAGGEITVHEVGCICPDEAALHIPSLNALAVADGVINYGGLRFVPDEYMDEPEQTKTDLKAAYGRLAEELDFDHLLPAHGDPVIGDGRDALRRSRRRLARLGAEPGVADHHAGPRLRLDQDLVARHDGAALVGLEAAAARDHDRVGHARPRDRDLPSTRSGAEPVIRHRSSPRTRSWAGPDSTRRTTRRCSDCPRAAHRRRGRPRARRVPALAWRRSASGSPAACRR